MKSTGIVRRVDQLGRIVIPIELRKKFDIASGAPMELYLNDDKIVFRKFLKCCSVCGSEENELFDFKQVKLCKSCYDKLKE